MRVGHHVTFTCQVENVGDYKVRLNMSRSDEISTVHRNKVGYLLVVDRIVFSDGWFSRLAIRH